jgi:hypothetical protein
VHGVIWSSKTGAVPAERGGIVLIAIHHADKT